MNDVEKIIDDLINHPSHYTYGDGMECIDEMILVFGIEAVMNFCLLNVWKYRKRALYKGKEEDLKKSDWYLNKYKELKEKQNDSSKTKYRITHISNDDYAPLTIPYTHALGSSTCNNAEYYNITGLPTYKK